MLNGEQTFTPMYLCAITLYFKLTSVRVSNLPLVSKVALRKRKDEEVTGCEWEGGRCLPDVPKCRWQGVWDRFSLLAHSRTAQTWRRPKSLKLGQESEQFPTPSALLLSP